MKDNSLKKQLLAQFYHKNRFLFCVAVFGSLLSGSLNLILSWTMQQLIDTASGIPGAIPLKVLTPMIAAFLFLCVGAYLVEYASKPGFILRAMEQYKDFAFLKLMEKNISSFHDEGTAAYLSALSNDASGIEASYLEQQFSLITKAVMFIGAFFMMLWFSPLMTLIAAGLTILPFIASVLTGGRLEAAERKVSDRNTDFTTALKDCLSGFPVVKSFQAEKEIWELFSKNNRSLEKEKFTRRRIRTMVGMIGALTGIAAQVGVFLAGSYLALSGRGVTPGAVIMFVNLMNFVIGPIAELPGILAGRKAAIGLVDKLADSLEKNTAPAGGVDIPGLYGGIRLENVSYGYGGEKEILHDISFTFEAGKAYAVVGTSGSGKSTLLNLLLASGGDYRGNIWFDEAELREIDSQSLYGLISVIQQQVFVFNASVKDNITMFRSFPEGEVEAAMEHAHLKELLEERGVSCLCGENGRNLSGGEKQRIAIARSLLKKSAVLLADEITAALDGQTAHQVAGDILELSGMTRIVVTHALEETLLRRYDGIIAMKDGRIAESGTFDGLMAKKGYFYALYTVAQ